MHLIPRCLTRLRVGTLSPMDGRQENLDDLGFFVAVVDAGGFSAAARAPLR